MLGNTEGERKTVWQRMRWLDNHHQLSGHESEPIPGDSEG